jgi:hypothetical protein
MVILVDVDLLVGVLKPLVLVIWEWVCLCKVLFLMVECHHSMKVWVETMMRLVHNLPLHVTLDLVAQELLMKDLHATLDHHFLRVQALM